MRQHIFCVTVFIIIFGLMSTGSVDAATKTENFDSDPGWTSFNLPVNNNDFGFRNSNFAGGDPGEAGGFFSRSDQVAWYGDDTIGNFTGDESLSASGLMNILNVDQGYNNNIHIGHFDSNGPSHINGIGFQILEYPTDGQAGLTFRIFYEIGETEGELFIIGDISNSRTWSYVYDPNGGDYGSLTVTISGLGGTTETVFLSESQRNSIGNLNTFGLAVGALGSASERLQLYIDNVSYTFNEPSALVGYWNFDEGNGTTANDSSGFSNQGTIEGATWPSGKCGNTALSFDGGSDGGIDYVVVPNSDSINTSTFTVSFWVSISDLDKTMVFLHKRNGQWWRNFQVSYNTVGPNGEPKDYLKVKIDDNGTPTPSNDFDNAAYAEVDLESGKFYYVAATYDQSYLRLFLNGSPIAQIAEFPIDITGNVGDGDLYIGAHSAEHLTMDPTNGIIDEVRIYNYALTQEQIQADMEACTPPPLTLEERVNALEAQVDELQQELDYLKGMESLVYSLEDQLNNLMQAIRECPTTKKCLDE